LKAVNYHKQTGASEGLMSVRTWDKIIDPDTKRRLFEGERTADSLRDRFKRTLCHLSSSDVDYISERVTGRTDEELKQLFCMFKKESKNSKRFQGISNRLAFSSNLAKSANAPKKEASNSKSKKLGAEF